MRIEERQSIEWACSQLIARYANLVDEGRWEEVCALYEPDGIMARPSAPDKPIVGAEAILAAFRDRPARYGRHICSNIVIDVETSARARARSSILLFTAAKEDSVDPAANELPRLSGMPLVGGYCDILVRGADGWRFAERRGHLAFRP